MNDTFNMSRLGCLIDRYYAMYRRHYLTALLIPAVLPWLLVGFMLIMSFITVNLIGFDDSCYEETAVAAQDAAE